MQLNRLKMTAAALLCLLIPSLARAQLIADRGGFGQGENSVAFGTAIVVSSGAFKTTFTYPTFVRYTAAGTAHTITLMRSASDTTITTAAKAADVNVVLAALVADGGGNSVAANDYVAIQLDNDTYHISTVKTWTLGTLTMELNTAIPTGRSVLAKARLFCYGVPADAYHTGYKFAAAKDAATNFPAVANPGPLMRSRVRGEPVLLHSDNATATGTLNNFSGLYCSY